MTTPRASMEAKLNPGVIDRILAAAQPAAVEAAARIAAACNEQSSWGGYRSGPRSDGKGANVWTISEAARADNARNQRILKNMPAGRR